jgi:histidinol dehydrogenase
MIKIIRYPNRIDWKELLKRPAIDSVELEGKVAAILKTVKQKGDAALKEYALQFDKVKLDSLQVSEEEINKAANLVSDELKKAIQVAKSNIEKFHTSQKEETKVIETSKGVLCWRKSIGIEKVGLYIPGGTAPLFSTVLMLGVPAQLAGCKEIILCTPCDMNGTINPAILFTAKLVGITKIFKVGGAQAIAAMAYGTESVPQVYKIFGPGNQYVTCAKQLVNKEGVAIDMPAGPSEVALLADETCIPEFVAADLLSQAEHGTDSQVVLVSDNENVIANVNSELEKQLSQLPRKEIATQALKNSKAILVKDLNEGMDLLNEYAPEHLIIACKNEEDLAGKVVNAGSVFLGNYSCESAGDYASGTNHTLPTNGYAKAYSGVSLDSFVKKITFQKLSQEGINTIGRTIELMAEAEGLDAHKNAVSIRIKNKV